MFVKRITACEKTQDAIILAGQNLEKNIKEKIEIFMENAKDLPATERLDRSLDGVIE